MKTIGECSVSHCNKQATSAQEGSLCASHYQFKYRGIDPESRKLRDDGRPDLVCWVTECKLIAHTKGLCTKHYNSAKQGKWSAPEHLGVKLNDPCLFEGCDVLQQTKGLCHTHYLQMKKAGKLKPIRDFQLYSIYDTRCDIDKCDAMAQSKGMCRKHDAIARKYGLIKGEISKLPLFCENPGCKNTTRLHVDHDHQTGKVRGMLCASCNTSLGQLGEDLERILGLAEYKKMHS